MKRFAVLPFLLFALACADTPTSVSTDDLALAADHHANAVSLIVNGGGRSDPSGIFGGTVFPEGTRVTYTFTARKKANGEVSGNVNYWIGQAPGFESLGAVREKVVCVSVEANTAYIGAVVVSAGEPWLVGLEMIFRVVDGGEGVGAVDYVSDHGFLWGTDCGNPEVQAEFDAFLGSADALDLPQQGNVQIIDKR